KKKKKKKKKKKEARNGSHSPKSIDKKHNNEPTNSERRQRNADSDEETARRQLLKKLKMEIDITTMDLLVNLNIIDLGFHAIGTDAFFEKVNAIVLVCDVTDASSLEQLLFKFCAI
ncbi:hypothetical protein RFI_33429, partial [Reticulomyxa filosa]